MIANAISLSELATTSLLVSLLLTVFLPLRPLLRRVIGSQWLCVLWLALLVRLLVPWPLESRWSLFNHWQGRTAHTADAVEPLKIKVSFPQDGGQKTAHTVAPNASPATIARPAVGSRWDLWDKWARWSFANTAWLAGVAFGLGMLAWRWIQTGRLAAKTWPVADCRLRNLFESIPRALHGDTQLRMTDALPVPTLAGVFRPQIWMPQSWPAQFTDEELRNVLLHELGHARRRDLLVQWVFAIVQCIHWFNPLVWVAARAARFDREMACDAWVLARGETDHSGYGAALMKTILLLRSPLYDTTATVAMASSRRNLHARISGIGAFRSLPSWRGVASILLMIAALATVTTSCKKSAETSSATTTSSIQSPAPASETATLADASVVSIQEEHALVVVNVGRRQGVKAGMPFKVMRGDGEIGLIRVVDVRDDTSGAVIQSLISDTNKIKVGDHLQVADRGVGIEVEAKFVEITEDAWKKLRDGNPSFEGFKSNFPELAREKPAYSKVADLLTELKKGAWEIPGSMSLLSVLSGDDLEKMTKSLNGVEGVDLLAAPPATTNNNQRTQFETYTEFRYASEYQDDKNPKPVETKNEAGETVLVTPPRFTPTVFTTKNVGLTLETTPKLNRDGTIDLTLSPTLAGFLGFVTEENGVKILAANIHDGGKTINRPAFTTLSGTTSVTVYEGQTVLLGGVQLDSSKDRTLKAITETNYFALNPGADPETVRRVMLIFVTAKTVDLNHPPATSPGPAVASAANPVSSFTGLAGKVLAINPGYHFVITDIGTHKGAVQNAEALVKRGDQTIAVLRINAVEPGTSIGDVIPGTQPASQQPKTGDKVVFTGRTIP